MSAWIEMLTAGPLAATVQEGKVRWAAMPPAWLVVVLVVVGFFWIRALYDRERGRAGKGTRLIMTLLRLLVLIGVGLVLAGPFRERTTTAQEKSHLVVLLDTSASMKVGEGYPADVTAKLRADVLRDAADGGAPIDDNSIERGRILRDVLTRKNAAVLRKMAERFVLHVFAFDADWRSIGTTLHRDGQRREARRDGDPEIEPIETLIANVEALPTEGSRTRIGAVLRRVVNEFARRPDQVLAGVVLMSDGRDTSEGKGATPQEVLTTLEGAEQELGVIAVGLGNPSSGRNLWVDRIRANDFVLVRDEVLFDTAIRHTDFVGSPVDVTVEIEQIADEAGEPIDARPYDIRRGFESRLRESIDALPDDEKGAPVRLRIPFDDAGTFRVRIRATLRDPDDRAADSVPDDDVATHEVRVVDQRIKVLYVENQPRHDWRFLSNYLTREPDARLARGREEARSRFLVHVLLQTADPSFRQPSSYGEPAIQHFPRTRKELFQYDVIIFGDVDWPRLDPAGRRASLDRLEQLVAFVEEGGGLALQAGVDYNTPLALLDTPLAQLLPINATARDRKASDVPLDQSFRIALTPAGQMSPIFSAVPSRTGKVPTPDEIGSIWRGDQSLSQDWHWWWLYRARGGLRPSATALARVQPEGSTALRDTRGEALPVFATMPFGKGRVFWSSIDNTARLRRGISDEIFGPFWEQILRDLATYRLLGGNKRYKIFTNKDRYFVGETATISIRALDPNFDPLRDPMLDGVRIERLGDEGAGASRLLEGDERPRSLADEGAPGTYRFELPLDRPGNLRIAIEREDFAGGRRITQRAAKRIEVNFRAQEDILKAPDHDTLLHIAKATRPQGADARVIAPWELAGVMDELPARPRERVLDRKEITLWDRAPILWLLVGLLAIEWILRKRWQMV